MNGSNGLGEEKRVLKEALRRRTARVEMLLRGS
jgi:hypothetical protein